MQKQSVQTAARSQEAGSAQDLPGLRRACRALAAGGAVVVPNPFPMASGVVATRAHAVNVLKRRRPERNVAVSLHDHRQWRQAAPCIDLVPAALDAVVALLGLRLTVLMPLRRRMPNPGWLAPAVRDGYLAAFNGYWTVTAALWERFPRLYGSSANITGELPVTDAAQAAAVFGTGCPVVDADAFDEWGPRSSSTMVRIDRVGRLDLYRPGAQDRASGLETDEFLRDLASAVGLSGRPDDHRETTRRG